MGNKNLNKILLTAITVGILSLVLLQIWANNTLANYGSKLTEIMALEDQIRLDNDVITTRIAELSSLSQIASKSAEMQFVVSQKVEYIR